MERSSLGMIVNGVAPDYMYRTRRGRQRQKLRAWQKQYKYKFRMLTLLGKKRKKCKTGLPAYSISGIRPDPTGGWMVKNVKLGGRAKVRLRLIAIAMSTDDEVANERRLRETKEESAAAPTYLPSLALASLFPSVLSEPHQLSRPTLGIR